MIELKVKSSSGGDAGTLSVDEAKLGGKVKKRLMHSAVIMYQANSRQGSACTRTRSEIAGSTKKLYRQKGTGRARAGSKKSGTRVGGGRIFGPKPRDFGYSMPKKARRAAMKSALLAKLKDDEVVVVEDFGLAQPSTREAAKVLASVGLEGAKVLVATPDEAKPVFLSFRNIAGTIVKRARDINALDVLDCKAMLIDKASFEALIGSEKAAEKADDAQDTEESKES